MTQSQALAILKTGANVFLTGEPGSGKTHTINAYVRYLREHGIEPAITASTGIAATHIHGQTIHSWSGIGVRRTLSLYDLDSIATTEYLSKRIRATSVLIIDEVSMIDGATLSMVEAVCRTVKGRHEPFGGIQVVLVGDFFQLPPVSRGAAAQFAFRSALWQSMQLLVCYLSEQHRQSDTVFLSVLSAIRSGDYNAEHHEHIEQRILTEEVLTEAMRHVTRLFSHNADVDALNDRELQSIEGAERRFAMQSKGKASLVAALKKGCLSPEVLALKVGAVVMCTKNSREKGVVNGTLGTVIGFDPQTSYPIVNTREGRKITLEPMEWTVEEGGKVKASITQVPLRLAWAITIHKSQGMSLDAAVMDLREVFEYGQGYVALSRVRTLSGLHLIGVNRRTFEVHPVIRAVDEQFRAASEAAEHSFLSIAPAELEKMHQNFLIAIGGSLSSHAPQHTGKKQPTHRRTLELVLEGKGLQEIAALRGLTASTVIGHLEKLLDEKLLSREQAAQFFDTKLKKALTDIEKAFKREETLALGPVFTHFKGKYSFDALRLARLFIRAQK